MFCGTFLCLFPFFIIIQHQHFFLPKCYFLCIFSKFDKFKLWNGINVHTVLMLFEGSLPMEFHWGHPNCIFSHLTIQRSDGTKERGKITTERGERKTERGKRTTERRYDGARRRYESTTWRGDGATERRSEATVGKSDGATKRGKRTKERDERTTERGKVATERRLYVFVLSLRRLTRCVDCSNQKK